MKKIIVFLLLFLCSCASATIDMVNEEGACKASYNSFLKTSDKINIDACGAKGTNKGSGSDSKAILDVLLRGLAN